MNGETVHLADVCWQVLPMAATFPQVRLTTWSTIVMIALESGLMKMRIILTNLIATVTVAHALLGCCWHHEHADAIASVAGAAAFADATDDHGCRHEGDSHEHDGPDGACHEESCAFLRADGPTHDALVSLGCPPLDSGSARRDTLAASVTVLHVAQFPSVALPVRWHLFKGVLLI